MAEPSRGLLLELSKHDAASVAKQTKQIVALRRQLPPGLIAQLVSMLPRYKPNSREAKDALERIFSGLWDTPEQTAFAGDDAALLAALTMLVDALGAIDERGPLETALSLFLRTQPSGSAQLPVPEAGLRVSIDIEDTGESRGGSRVRLEWLTRTPPAMTYRERISKVALACQSWCRVRIVQATAAPR